MSKKSSQPTQRMHVPFHIRAIAEDGTFEGYASVFDAVDSHHSRFLRGCFTKTIQEKRGVVPILDEHWGGEIGLTSELAEDSYGLRFKGKLYISDDAKDEVQAARERYVRMKRRQEAGAPQPMSFGFRPVKDRFGEDGVLEFQEVELREVSPVTEASQPLANVLSVRSGLAYSSVEYPLTGVVAEEITRAFARLSADFEMDIEEREEALRLVLFDGLHARAAQPVQHVLQRADLSHATFDVRGFCVEERVDVDVIYLCTSGVTEVSETLARTLPYTSQRGFSGEPFVPIASVTKGKGEAIVAALPALQFHNLPLEQLEWVDGTRSQREAIVLRSEPEATPEPVIVLPSEGEQWASLERAGAELSRKNKKKLRDVSKMLAEAASALASMVDDDEANASSEPQRREPHSDTQTEPSEGALSPEHSQNPPPVPSELETLLARAEQRAMGQQLYDRLNQA